MNAIVSVDATDLDVKNFKEKMNFKVVVDQPNTSKIDEVSL